MVKKNFYIPASQIKKLMESKGFCFATDYITVDGKKVGYIYREEPDNSMDTGWRFMAGDESDEYIDNPENMGIYDENTIANYDPEIIPYLDSPIGSAYERDLKSAKFKKIELNSPKLIAP
jgi:hypothetical protein